MPTRRIINIVNFIRFDDPRDPTLDLFEPVKRQMQLLREAGLPCTWLLQFDALVAGPYAEFFRKNLPDNHEIGLWFEINRMHCDAAGVPFRGADGVNWDYHVQAAFSVGYSPDERDRLADFAVERFRCIFGYNPRSVAAWYIDAHTLARLSDLHGVDAFAVCRDQYGTDGYTFWGGPFSGGYYPSRCNTLSPAQTPAGQIGTPVFRLLGPDPINQYDTGLGTTWQGVLTLEPIYAGAGKDPGWVKRFLDIVALAPALSLMHAQAGQENSFGWPAMAEGYAMQVAEFQKRRESGELMFETLGETGRWFQSAFPPESRGTPAQAIIALHDTLEANRRSIWYFSKHYRCNLLIEGDRLYLRDMHLFDETHAERYLEDCCDLHAARFGTLPILDGFGWSASERDRALGRWLANGDELRMASEPEVVEASSEKDRLVLRFPVNDDDALLVTFEPEGWNAVLVSGRSLLLAVRWAQTATTTFSGLLMQELGRPGLGFEHEGTSYSLPISAGAATATVNGVDLVSNENGVLSIQVLAAIAAAG